MSKSKVQIKGLDEIQANINTMVKGIKGRTMDGVIAAGMAVQANAMDYTPVLTGNLRASFSVRSAQTSQGPAARVVNTAAYSLSVHEMNVPYLQLGLIDAPIVKIVTARARI